MTELASVFVFVFNVTPLSREQTKPRKPCSLGGREPVLIAENVRQPIGLGYESTTLRVVAFGQTGDGLDAHQSQSGLSCNGNHCTVCHSHYFLSAQSDQLHNFGAPPPDPRSDRRTRIAARNAMEFKRRNSMALADLI